MITGLAIFVVVFVAAISHRENQKDRAERSEYLRFSRQDLRLAVYLLAAIMVLLGVIADKIR